MTAQDAALCRKTCEGSRLVLLVTGGFGYIAVVNSVTRYPLAPNYFVTPKYVPLRGQHFLGSNTLGEPTHPYDLCISTERIL